MPRENSRERPYDRSYRGRPHHGGDGYRRERNNPYDRGDRGRPFDRYSDRQNYDNRPRNFGGRDNNHSGRQNFIDRNCPMPESVPVPETAISFETGTTGRVIDAVTNNFIVNVKDCLIWQFHVSIGLHKDMFREPKGDGAETQESEKAKADSRLELFLKRFGFQVVAKFLEGKKLNSKPYAFDGSKTLFFQSDVGFAMLEDVVELPSNGRNIKFNVRIERVAHISLGQVSDYYQGKQAELPECLKMLFDIVFRDVAAQHYETFQGNNFDLTTATSKQGIDDVQFVNGFRRCVRQTLSGFVLNVHLKTACVLSSAFTSLETIYQVKNRHGSDLSSINALVKNLEVYCTHGKHRVYRIDKLINQRPTEIFLDQDTTMLKYFREKYNIDLNPNNPVVKVVMRKDTFLPLELCSMKLQQFLAHSKMTPNIQREVLMKSTNPPNVYFNKLDTFVKKISSDNARLEAFGLKLDPRPMLVKARVLPQPRNLGAGRNEAFVKPSKAKYYSIFCLEELNSRMLDDFCNNFESSSRRYGLRLSCHTRRVLTVRRIEDLVNMCKVISERLSDQIILIAIPKSNSGVMPSQIYNFIKFQSERIHAFVTQCIKVDVIYNLPRGYMDNFLLKVNGKFDGLNQALESDAFEGLGFNPSKTMVIGYDVNHPSSHEMTNHSIVAVVGSLDKTFSKYSSSLSKQVRSRQEMVEELDSHIEKLLTEFHRMNRVYPETLIVFRDGITEQQFDLCRDVEIASIEHGAKRLGLHVKIVFLIAQKRHGVRFGLTTPDTSGRNPSYNLPAGSVVDTGVVSAKCPNFFLTAHHSPLGTARNIHVYVFKNDIKMSMDQIQCFVFRSCFNSIRSRQISFIPLALRYVDLLAYRGKLYSEANHLSQSSKPCHAVEDKISNNLFYC